MRGWITGFIVITGMVSAALAASPLQVTIEGIRDGQPIPPRYALCKATADGKSKSGSNIRPTISWSGAPASTKSYAVIVTDPDVPADFSDASQAGKVVKAKAKRQLFYHWALADIPANVTRLKGGRSGKAPGVGTPAKGSLGKYVDNPTQYGGPCPPWNDELVHHYHFTVYALDVAKLKLPSDPTAKQVEKALGRHVLARGEVTGTYTLNASKR